MGAIWGILASSGAALTVGVVSAILLVVKRQHLGPDGRVQRVRIVAVFGLSAAAYTFAVCVSAQLVFHHPTITQIISDGFGSERVALLLAIVAGDNVLRVWDEFHPAPSSPAGA